MDIVLIIIAAILAIVGIIGSILPGLPGPPFSWVGLLLVYFVSWINFSPWILVATAAICIFITVLDYVVPSALTKRYGGSKAGVWGCNIGLLISIIGLPFGPQGLIGVIAWPFVGALVGELLTGTEPTPAFKAAYGSLLGFLTGTFVKVIYSLAILVYMIVLLV